MSDQYKRWMERAIQCALRGWGDTHPNPMVGALVVEGGKVVAEGYHVRAGELHAERQALKQLGRMPKPGATMVVTLEPCSTYGRQPPCVEAVLQAGVAKLIVGATDANPKHAGRGLDILRENGVEVITGVLAEKCQAMNLIFEHVIQNPYTAFFAAKVAATLDGKIATRTGQSKWITGAEAREDVARWRRYFPAIMVSAKTVIADNPKLTSRMAGTDEHCPTRLIVDLAGVLNEHAESHVIADSYAFKTIVLTHERCEQDADYLTRFRDAGGRVYAAPLIKDRDHIDWSALKEWCISNELYGVYIEPGSGLMRSLIEQDALNYLFYYTAPKLMADEDAVSAFSGQSPESMDAVMRLHAPVFERFGEDSLVRGYLRK